MIKKHLGVATETHRLAVTETKSVYYEFTGTLEEAQAFCKKFNDDEDDQVDLDDQEQVELIGQSDWVEQSNLRVV